MDWSNERYVRVYTRDTTTWKLMDWRGRAVLSLLFRKVDRAGVLDVGHDGVLGLAAVLELPLEIVEAGIAQLTSTRGGQPTVVDTGTAYVIPNFLDAQEAPQADAQRKRESRSRRRDIALAVSRKMLPPGAGEAIGHETGQDRHIGSQVVTPCLPVPSRSDPEEESPSLAHAIPPSPVPSTTPAQSFADRDLAKLRVIGDLARATWQRLSELRMLHAGKLGLHGVIAFPLITPGHQPRAFDELRERIREEGDNARATCDHVLSVLDEQARVSKSIEWLSEKAFLERPWSKARETVLSKRKPAAKAAAAAPTPIPAENLAGAAELAESWRVLGISKEPA